MASVHFRLLHDVIAFIIEKVNTQTHTRIHAHTVCVCACMCVSACVFIYLCHSPTT